MARRDFVRETRACFSAAITGRENAAAEDKEEGVVEEAEEEDKEDDDKEDGNPAEETERRTELASGVSGTCRDSAPCRSTLVNKRG